MMNDNINSIEQVFIPPRSFSLSRLRPLPIQSVGIGGGMAE